MKQAQAKLKSNRGETLVEVLASVLIASLSVLLLLGCVAASVNMGRTADGADAYFYQVLTAAEAQTTPVATDVANPKITVRQGGVTVEIPVLVYGDEGLYSYALNAGEGSP